MDDFQAIILAARNGFLLFLDGIETSSLRESSHTIQAYSENIRAYTLQIDDKMSKTLK